MSHINYSFNQTDDSLPRDKMKLRNIASTRYSGDWPSIPHSHSYAELFYIVDGAGQFQINDKLFPVQAHQLVVVNPNVIHTEVSLESHPLEYIVLGIEGLEFTISDAAEGSFCVYTFDGNNDVLPCMRKILTEMQNRESNFQILCQAYMDIIVVQLMRNASVSAVPIHSRLPANRQCATVKRYIDHHYKEILRWMSLLKRLVSANITWHTLLSANMVSLLSTISLTAASGRESGYWPKPTLHHPRLPAFSAFLRPATFARHLAT